MQTIMKSAVAALALSSLFVGCATTPPPANFAEIVAAPDRSDADRANDKKRNPVQLYSFTGAGPGMKVLDVGAGGGYTTEMLARAVAPNGTVYSQTAPGLFPGANKAYEARAKSPAMKTAVRIEQPFENPAPAGVNNLDLITFFFFYHDTVWLNVDRAKMNRALFNALKPGGILVVADHSAKAGEGTNATKSLHRIEESVVRRELETAGFQFVAEGNFLRNPADPREVQVQKNTVPNDEFVLKFRKP